MCPTAASPAAQAIFQPREEHDLVHRIPRAVEAPFVLEQIAFFAKGVQIYQGFNGPVFRGLGMDTRRSDAAYAALGPPLARRSVHETVTDLFAVSDWVLNFGVQDAGRDAPLAHALMFQGQCFDVEQGCGVFFDAARSCTNCDRRWRRAAYTATSISVAISITPATWPNLSYLLSPAPSSLAAH